MRSPRLPLLLIAPLAFAMATTSVASALDHPISSAAKLTMARKGDKEKLVFLAKDPSFLFPAIGGADDPSLAGATVDIVPDPKHYPGSLSLTGGWTSKVGGAGASYKFKNDTIAAIATVRVQLKQGKQIKITAKSLGGLGVYPVWTHGFVVRITTGSLRNCVRFGPPPTQSYFDGFKFVAKEPSAEILADCSDASIGMPSECDFSYPTCGGACPAGETCTTFGIDPGFGRCGCIPTGATPCGTPGVPTCGGACPIGQVCRPAFGLPSFGSHLECDCGEPEQCGSGGIECANGLGCGYMPPQGRACVPILCGSYPSCSGEPCRDGGECVAVSVGGGSGVCVCAVPGTCASCTGYGCPPGEVCAAGTCGCQAP